MNFMDFLRPPKRTDFMKEYGLNNKKVAVLVNDWLCLGPMVSEVFEPFVITGNPQEQIPKNKNNIFLTEIFSKLTDTKMLIPYSEKSIHKIVMGNGKLGNLLPNDKYQELIASKLHMMSNDGVEYVFPYQCFNPDFDFFDDFFMSVLGPRNLSIRDLLSNKVHFYEFLERNDIVRIPGEVVDNVKDAAEIFKNYKEVYIAKERGAGGSGSFHFKSSKDIIDTLGDYNGRLVVLKWLDEIVNAPNVLAITPNGTSNPDDVVVVSISDQIIRGTGYFGNSFPTNLNEREFNEVVRITKKLGARLSEKGFCGIFGLDAVKVKENGDYKIYPVELNLRVNHSHGLASILYSRLRPDCPPVALMHALATTGKGWVDKSLINKILIKPKEMPNLVMEVVKFKGNLVTTRLPELKSFSIGFPPAGWTIPESNIDCKSGEFRENEPMFIGRLLSTDKTLKQAFDASSVSIRLIKNSYKRG